MTLTDFLLARIAEDEEAARRVLDMSDYGVTRDWQWVRFYGPDQHLNIPSSTSHWRGAPSPDRVLAECDSKRRIVEWDEVQLEEHPVLRFLALPYADHPDYRDEWRP